MFSLSDADHCHRRTRYVELCEAAHEIHVDIPRVVQKGSAVALPPLDEDAASSWKVLAVCLRLNNPVREEAVEEHVNKICTDQNFLLALERDKGPSSIALVWCLGQFCADRRRFAFAEQLYLIDMRKGANREGVYNIADISSVVTLYQRQGKMEEIEILLRDYTELTMTWTTENLVWLAMIHDSIGNCEKALRVFEVSLERLNGKDNELTSYERRRRMFSFISIAQIHVDRGQPEIAVKALENITGKTSDEPDDVDMRLCLEQLAIAYTHCGLADEAETTISCLQHALAEAFAIEAIRWQRLAKIGD